MIEEFRQGPTEEGGPDSPLLEITFFSQSRGFCREAAIGLIFCLLPLEEPNKVMYISNKGKREITKDKEAWVMVLSYQIQLTFNRILQQTRPKRWEKTSKINQ